MSPRHFDKLSKDQWGTFDHDLKIVTGMLYTIAKLPLKPFTPAFYKTAGEVKKDYEPLYNPPMDE
jgi:hypothetical protein